MRAERDLHAFLLKQLVEAEEHFGATGRNIAGITAILDAPYAWGYAAALADAAREAYGWGFRTGGASALNLRFYAPLTRRLDAYSHADYMLFVRRSAEFAQQPEFDEGAEDGRRDAAAVLGVGTAAFLLRRWIVDGG